VRININEVVKACCALEAIESSVATSLAGVRLNPTRSDACNAQTQSTLLPALGATCGRREREADAGNEEEQSFHVLVVATVEDTLVHETSVAFAGCRRNVGLGRSVMPVGGSFPCRRSHR
jgi:hypothetical protein